MIDLILIILFIIVLLIYISFKGEVDLSGETEKTKWSLKGKNGHFKYTKETKINKNKERRKRNETKEK